VFVFHSRAVFTAAGHRSRVWPKKGHLREKNGLVTAVGIVTIKYCVRIRLLMAFYALRANA